MSEINHTAEKNASYRNWNGRSTGITGRYRTLRPVRISRRSADGVEFDEMPAGHEVIIHAHEFSNAGFRGIEAMVRLPDGWRMTVSAGALERV